MDCPDSKTKQRYYEKTIPRIAKALETISRYWGKTREEAEMLVMDIRGTASVGMDLSALPYQDVMDFCKRIEIQKVTMLVEKHRGRDVLRKCASEMGFINKQMDELLIKNRVAACKKKITKELGIDYTKYLK